MACWYIREIKLFRWNKLIFAHQQVGSYLLELLCTNKY